MEVPDDKLSNQLSGRANTESQHSFYCTIFTYLCLQVQLSQVSLIASDSLLSFILLSISITHQYITVKLIIFKVLYKQYPPINMV